MKSKLFSIAAVITALTLLTACSSTRLISSWKGNVPANTMNKVLVFSLVGQKATNLDYQDSFEDQIVLHLKSVGVDAYSAYDTFGPSALKKMDKEGLAKQIRDGKYTGVMILVLLDKDQEDEYVPPTTTTYAVPVGGPVYYDPWFHPYYSYYNYYYDQVTTPGYWTTTTTYVLQARLFNAQDEADAVYTGTTSTTDPDDAFQVAKDFASTIISDMKTKKVIQ